MKSPTTTEAHNRRVHKARVSLAARFWEWKCVHTARMEERRVSFEARTLVRRMMRLVWCNALFSSAPRRTLHLNYLLQEEESVEQVVREMCRRGFAVKYNPPCWSWTIKTLSEEER